MLRCDSRLDPHIDVGNFSKVFTSESGSSDKQGSTRARTAFASLAAMSRFCSNRTSPTAHHLAPIPLQSIRPLHRFDLHQLRHVLKMQSPQLCSTPPASRDRRSRRAVCSCQRSNALHASGERVERAVVARSRPAGDAEITLKL